MTAGTGVPITGSHPLASPDAPLVLDLRWQSGGQRYQLRATCGPGITAIEGPAAPALLRLLAGRPIPHMGTVLLDGRPLAHGAAAARRGPRVRPVASILPDDSLPRWRTPLGLVAGAVRLHGVPIGGARARAMQALRWLDATHLARRPVLYLDMADRRRVALAQALALVPGLLLLDQPCAPLPRHAHERIYTTLHELATSWQMIVLLIPDSTQPATLPTLAPHLID